MARASSEAPTPAPADAPELERGRPQMADLARLAGVSVATVSRALNGSSEVSQATRQRISELARSMNYTVNAGAKSLRTKVKRTVALVVPRDPTVDQPISDPFFLALIGHLADALTSQGFDVLLSRVPTEGLGGLHDSGVATALIQLGQLRDHDALNALARRGVPLVVWGAQLPDQAYCCIGGDNFRGGALAAEHLVAHGRQRIAFIGDRSLPEPQMRWQGFDAALRRHGLALDPALHLDIAYGADLTRDALQELLDSGAPFDAVFACSDVMAIAAQSQLRRHGLRVPEDVMVVGYDDIDWAAHADPPLTSVRQALAPAVGKMVEALLRLIGGERAASVQMPVALVVRQS
ncbi:MAG: LacI family DNA-binding transcriptional regulator [Leptothrix sp. (in: b-proteobacteria)]